MRVVTPLVCGSSVLLASVLAQAAPPAEPIVQAPAPAEVEPEVYGGMVASSCQWPTTVGLFNGSSICSATLVHPRVVLTAAHCMDAMAGGPPDEIRFGEDIFDPELAVDVEQCQINPGWGGGVGSNDYAYCTLTQPVDLPPTPPIMGCEVLALSQGAEVAVVGFGLTDEGENDAGTKRWGLTEVTSEQIDLTVAVGTADTSTCSGDSGSTAYVQLEDGGWRSFGILSGGPEGCDNYGIYVTMYSMAGWVEEQTGYDITPCHDPDGTWNPGPECTGTASEPAATGAWGQGCAGPVGEEPASCGPGQSWPEDLDAPAVEIVSPEPEENFPESPTTFDITVETDDGDGYAVLSVELFVNDTSVGTRERLAWEEPGPWVFANAEFTNGSYTLTAFALDYEGNQGVAEPVTFTVGEQSSETETGGEEETDTGEEETDTGGGDETAEVPLSPVDDSGCGCSLDSKGAGGPSGWAFLWLSPLLALGFRRREG